MSLPDPMETFLLDLRFAVRSLRRRPVFAGVAIATIALAIGAATSIYSVVDGVLFRSLPVRDASRLVAIWQTDSVRKNNPILAAYWDRVPLDYTDFITWRSKQTSFDAVGVWSRFGAMVRGDQGLEQITGTRVSPGLFEMLGVRPLLGRTFLPGEDVLGGPRVVMLSFESWTSRFGARRDVVGTLVRFDDVPYEIIGVLPPGFTLERGQTAAPYWMPTGQRDGDVGRRNRGFHAIARLRAGVSLAQATAETRVLLNTSDPTANRGIRIEGYVRDETREVRRPLFLLLGAVGVLLLVACVNIATLLLGEAATRDMEISARIALGATRGRIIRQLLTESGLLSGIGGALGVVLAWWATKLLVAVAPAKIPGIAGVSVDIRVLAAALVMAGATGLLFGLAPAILLSQSGPASLLRIGQSIRGRGRLQRTMIAAELSLSVVLLVGAALLVKSLRNVSAVDPGFSPDRLAVVRLSFANPFADTARLRSFYRDALPRLVSLPGVESVTAASNAPFTGGSSSSPYLLPGEGDAERQAHKHEVQQRVVADNYFATMGIAVIAGRSFSSEDRGGSTPVAIISEAAARRDFPNESAIGKRVNYQGTWREIVGVVRDVKHNRLSAADQPALYTPIGQRLGVMDVIVRARRDPAKIAAALRSTVLSLEPGLAVTGVDDVEDLIHRSFGEERFRTGLISLFAVIAGVLAAVGMYGVTSRAVARRTREVGIRVALGATTASVVRLVVRQSARGVLTGVIVGALGALAASRVVAPYLFGVSAHDPAIYAGIVAVLTAVSLLSSWIPARRAGRIEPGIVLRGE